MDVPEDFKTYRYSDFLGRTFKLVNAADRYQDCLLYTSRCV